MSPEAEHSSASQSDVAGERSWDVWFYVGGLLAFCAAIAARKLGDFDLPWHIAQGRAVAALGRIPKLDPLAFTHQRLLYIEPLSEVPLFGLWRAGGAPALQVAGGVVSAGIGALLFWQLRRRGPIAYGASALALASMSTWLIVRAATFSFLLIALVLGLLELHARSSSPRVRRRILWVFPPLVLGWASMHGFAFIGAGLCAAYAGYVACCCWARGRLGALLPANDGRDAGAVAASAVLAVLASLLNAAGPMLRVGPSRFANDALSQFKFGRVTEAAVPTLDFFLHHEPLGPIVALLALLALFVGRDQNGKRAIPSAFDIGLVLLGLLGMLWMVRAVPLGVLLMTPVIARRLGAYVPTTALSRWSLALSPWLAAGYALIQASVGLGFGFEPTHFPERAVAFIERQNVTGHMYNFAPFGGYLSLNLYPTREIFMDGRLDDARDPSLVLRADQALSDSDVFHRLADEFDMQYAVVNAREGEASAFPLARANGWAMVHLDDVAAVYVRRGGPNDAVAQSGYRILRHLSDMGHVLSLASQGGPAAELLLHDGQLAAAQDPTSARAAFFLACGELAVHADVETFGRSLQRLALLAPGNPVIPLLAQRFQEVTGMH